MIDFNYVWLALSAAVAFVLAWLAVRAFRARNRLVKWAGGVVASLIAALVCGICVVVGTGLYRVQARNAPVPQLEIAGTPEQLARGKAISDGFCSACHTLALVGGEDIGKHFPMPVGQLIAANLTPGGALKGWSDGEIFRAIRNSVDADGRLLTVMALTNVSHLSDDDAHAVIAYLRSLPATGAPTPPDRLTPIGVALIGAGMLPSGGPVVTTPISAPPKGPTAAFGEYILSYQDCRACHGKDLSGGVAGQLPPIGPDLHLVKDWTLQGFTATMRTGVDPNGHKLAKEMPWEPIGRMDDEELAAIYQYLTHLPES